MGKVGTTYSNQTKKARGKSKSLKRTYKRKPKLVKKRRTRKTRRTKKNTKKKMKVGGGLFQKKKAPEPEPKPLTPAEEAAEKIAKASFAAENLKIRVGVVRLRAEEAAQAAAAKEAAEAAEQAAEAAEVDTAKRNAVESAFQALIRADLDEKTTREKAIEVVENLMTKMDKLGFDTKKEIAKNKLEKAYHELVKVRRAQAAARGRALSSPIMREAMDEISNLPPEEQLAYYG